MRSRLDSLLRDGGTRCRKAARLMAAMKTRLALFLFLLCMASPPGARAQQQPQAMPPPPSEVSFKLKGVDGKTYDVAEMRGQVLLVSFGASWCQPCAAELTALEQLRQEFREQPVKFLWISIESEDEASDGKLRSFAKSKGIGFPVLRDESGFVYSQFSSRRRIPLVIFINQEGKLVLPQHAGMAEPELYKRTMRERLKQLLPAQAPTASSGAN
jgi:peroxiredoxin